MKFTTRGKAIKEVGVSYLGGVSTSSKLVKNEKLGIQTYVLYLAPHTMSGYNVCPKATADCIAACLNESGHNRIDVHENRINKSRITKTKLFMENRDYFMGWLVAEINAKRAAAERDGYIFSIRINGTSDLDLTTFKLNGKNIFEIFPDVQFYDYTKVFKRVNLLEKYSNYDLTFSFSGKNWLECEAALAKGVRVAVVFEKELPAFYKGMPVISGDESDVRFLDPQQVIVGLKQKMVRNKIDISTQSFIIPYGHPDCDY